MNIERVKPKTTVPLIVKADGTHITITPPSQEKKSFVIKNMPTKPTISKYAPTASVKKPAPTEGIVIEKRQTKQIEIKRLESYTYDLEKMRSYRHDSKFESPETIMLHTNLIRYKNVIHPKRNPFGVVARDEDAKMMQTIKSSLNKLTMEKFRDILDVLSALPKFNTENFARVFIKEVFETVKVSPLFALLYSLLIQAIALAYNETSTAAYKDIIIRDIQVLCEQALTQTFENVSDAELESLNGVGILVGSLYNRGIVTHEYVSKIVTSLLSNPNQFTVQIAVNVLLPCCQEFESKKSPETKEVFKILKKVAADRSFPGKPRYFTLDFLQAKENNYDFANMLPQIYSLDNVAKRKASTFSVTVHHQPTTPKITVGKNMFAGLDDLEEEEEFEEISEFDAGSFLREFIYDAVINDTWSPEHIQPLLFSLVQQSLSSFTKAVSIISLLKEEDKLDKEESVKALIEVADKVNTPEYLNDIKNVRELCAQIFAEYLKIGYVESNQFGEILKNYTPSMVAAFMYNLVRSKKENLILEDNFWLSQQWVLPTHSILEISKCLGDEKLGGIISNFIEYEHVFAVYDLVENETPIEEVVSIISEEFPEEAKNSKTFALGLIEYLAFKDYDGELVENLIQFVASYQTEVLLFAEQLSQKKGDDHADAAKTIDYLVKVGKFNIDEYKSAPGSEFHEATAKLL